MRMPAATARSYGRAEKIEAQLKAEVQELMKRAAATDHSSRPDGVKRPAEINRREDRLAAIAAAQIEARAAERFEHEQAEPPAKLAARAKKEADTGKKPEGKGPKPQQAGPRPRGQIHLTDEGARMMPVSGGGFEQSFNARAAVDTEPMLKQIQAHPAGLNPPETWRERFSEPEALAKGSRRLRR